jgi:hypothetical protein
MLYRAIWQLAANVFYQGNPSAFTICWFVDTSGSCNMHIQIERGLKLITSSRGELHPRHRMTANRKVTRLLTAVNGT